MSTTMDINGAVANGKVTGMAHVTDATLSRLVTMKQQKSTVQVNSYLVVFI